MTPEEKAKELINLFYESAPPYVKERKEGALAYAESCALIAVEEIQKLAEQVPRGGIIEFWQQVKEEIKKV